MQYSAVAYRGVNTSEREKEQVMAEQRKTLTQSMTRKRTPKTTQSHRSQEGPSSQSPVAAGGRGTWVYGSDGDMGVMGLLE